MKISYRRLEEAETMNELDAVLKAYGIERRIALDYPTRYEAFDNPGVLYEQTEESRQRRYVFEFAVLRVPMANHAYPHLEDGIYAQIGCNGKAGFFVEVMATQPDQGREQKNIAMRKDTYEAAAAELATMLVEAFRFVGLEQSNYRE